MPDVLRNVIDHQHVKNGCWWLHVRILYVFVRQEIAVVVIGVCVCVCVCVYVCVCVCTALLHLSYPITAYCMSTLNEHIA